MKKFVAALGIAILGLNTVSAQNMMDLVSPTHTDLFRNKAMGIQKYEKAVGSPYLDEKFNLANISGVKDLVLVRYNAESDEMDIDNGEQKIYTLPKNDEYHTITFKNGMFTFKLRDYTDAKGKPARGYLIEKFSNNDIALYRKERVVFMAGKEAVNSYSNDVPPKLNRAKEEYYLQTKDGKTVEFPNKKGLISMYPNKKSEIEKFLKENKLGFNRESDLIAITKFIANL
ncbi:MAG: hypothetical protein IR153_07475 [Flavobacterium sp.]|nr:hypothetical protein [Flavobacterium sp.]